MQVHLDSVRFLVDQYARMRFVLDAQVTFDVRPGNQAYVHGAFLFVDDSSLHFREYLDTIGADTQKLMYLYHYQNSSGTPIFRYDNSRHQPALSFGEHKHLGNEDIIAALAPSLASVLSEIVALHDWL